MLFRPKIWTHHHEARIFHLILCVSFIGLAIVSGLGLFLRFREIKAAEVYVENGVGASTRVEGGADEEPEEITPTTTPGSGNGSGFPNPQTPTTTTPTGQTPTSPGTTPTTTTPPVKPEQKPTPLPNVFYEISVTIPENYKAISPGEKFYSFINLKTSTPPKEAIRATIYYSVIDEAGDEVISGSDTVFVKDQIILKKPIITYTNLTPGIYTLKVTSTVSGNLEATDIFQVKGIPALYIGGGITINQTVVFQALFFLLLFFLLIAYFEYHKVAIISAFIRKIDEYDIKLINP